MSRVKLSDEKLDDLRDILDSDGMKVIFSVVEALVHNMERDVLNVDINTHSFSQLAVTKAKCDGAKLLQKRLVEEINKLKGDKNGRN
jgi:hypothetical protein